MITQDEWVPTERDAGQMPQPKPRLLVLTDISSLTPRVREPDDGQSLTRLMLYACDLDIEGLVASSNLGHGQVVRPELIHQVIVSYAQVRPNLLRHRAAYPTVKGLERLIKAGQPIAGPKTPLWDSIGPGKDTEASERIIAAADSPDPRPLWVAAWGGTADLAQALWKVRQTRSPQEVAAWMARLRIHAVYDQDSTAAWIKDSFPDLYYITRTHGIRGMYRGGDMSLVSPEWVEAHVRNGHGPLGALYPNYDGGDIWSSRLGAVRGTKEGDTPSYLGLIPNGLNERIELTWGGWGGRCTFQAPNRYVDAADDLPETTADPDPRLAAVHRWRPAYQADLQARLDWCVQTPTAANHPPMARMDGALERTVAPGDVVVLDGSASSDPDGDGLDHTWWVYREAGSYAGPLDIRDTARPVAHFLAPQVPTPATIHAVLTVRDEGDPPLTGYARVLITVDPR